MIGDHPDIHAALESGYPLYTRQSICPRCGYDLGDKSFEVDGENLCLQCFSEWVNDYLRTNPEEVADALFIDVHVEG